MAASPLTTSYKAVRCPSCGSERVRLRSRPDPIDRIYQTTSDRVKRLFVKDMQLYHCYVCRLQFYDTPQVASSPAAAHTEAAIVDQAVQQEPVQEPVPEKAVAAEAAAETTVIGGTMTIIGSIISGEDILVNGTIEGPLDIVDHCVRIARTGRIRGNLRAAEVIADGVLEGGVEARRKFTLRASASMTGNLRSPAARIEEGAYFKGRLESA